MRTTSGFRSATLLHEEGDYQAAYAQYQQVDPYELDFSRFDEYNFRTGYAAYMCGDTDKAYGYFKNCNTDPQYKPHATYYIAYIDYSRGDLQAAKREFAVARGQSGLRTDHSVLPVADRVPGEQLRLRGG